MVHVVETGNPRKGSATSGEIKQCHTDISAWFSKELPQDDSGYDEALLEEVEKACDAELPQSLALILASGSDWWFYEKRLLPGQAIVKMIGDLEGGEGWRPNLIPFAADVDDNFLVADIAKNGAVLEWDESGKGEGSCLAKSFSAFIEDYRNQLLSGAYEYVEDLGVIEKVKGK
ncbi:unnamed protein product [Chrysoparadoxa australica]